VLEKEKYGSKVLGWLNEFKSVWKLAQFAVRLIVVRIKSHLHNQAGGVRT
jgi:hypothetical protein